LLRRLYVLFFIEYDTPPRSSRRCDGQTRPDLGDPASPKRLLRPRRTDNGCQVLAPRPRHEVTSSFDAVFAGEGIGVIKTPIRAPRASAIAERFVGTVRRECLDRLLVLGRRHLEVVLAEYIEHYNRHRRHRSLDQHSPRAGPGQPVSSLDLDFALVEQTEVLCGLIHEYRLVP
jgi:putative transposase